MYRYMSRNDQKSEINSGCWCNGFQLKHLENIYFTVPLITSMLKQNRVIDPVTISTEYQQNYTTLNVIAH